MTSDTKTASALAPLLASAEARRAPLPEPTMRRLLRVRAGLTQAEIAGLLGVQRPSVTRYETGAREPRGAVRSTYAQLLGALARKDSGDA